MAPIKTYIGNFAQVAFTVTAPKSNNNCPSSSHEQKTSINPAGDDVSSFSKMCRLFHVEPANNLYLSTSGERGVCLNKAVKDGEPILSIPISSCFRDDEPPSWYQINDRDCEDVIGERYNPSGWATRLAASVLDMELNQGRGDISEEGNNEELKLGREIWQSMLPNKELLRASLPVHWKEEVLATSKCTALELAVDSAYFGRANAVMDLSEELKKAIDVPEGWSMMNDEDVNDVILDMDALQRKCHDALDIVQTRVCSVERKFPDGVQYGPPLRILAPVFDFINHGSSRMKVEGSANACFELKPSVSHSLQDAKLVVYATRDIAEFEEVLIDYGDSATPAWRGLTSYGFVPEYDESTCVAEMWMNGQRFEVDTQSVPYDLVEVAAAQALLDQSYEDGEIEQVHSGESDSVPPFVARAIVKRATEAALNLITEPDQPSEHDWDVSGPDFVHAMSLASLLRWRQHKVLLMFADNLKAFAEQEEA